MREARKSTKTTKEMSPRVVGDAPWLIEQSLHSLWDEGLCSIRSEDLQREKTQWLKKKEKNTEREREDLGRWSWGFTFENEGGFADASGAVKDEGLMDEVVLSMVVEDRLH